MFPRPDNPRHAYWTGLLIGIVVGLLLSLAWIVG